MVKYHGDPLDLTFAALSDPIRRSILKRLQRGEASVTELAGPFRVSLPAISKHLRVLERAGLVARKRSGRMHRIRLAAKPMKDAAQWLAMYRQFWDGQLDSLGQYLTTLKREGKRK